MDYTAGNQRRLVEELANRLGVDWVDVADALRQSELALSSTPITERIRCRDARDSAMRARARAKRAAAKAQADQARLGNVMRTAVVG